MKPFTLDDAQVDLPAPPRQAKIPALDKLDDAILPVDAVSRYLPLEGLPPPPEPKHSLEVSGQLTEIVDLSLIEAKKMIEREWSDLTEKEAAIKSSLIQTMFSTQIKVDDTRLRARQVDILPKLLAEIAKVEKRMPKLIEG